MFDLQLVTVTQIVKLDLLLLKLKYMNWIFSHFHLLCQVSFSSLMLWCMHFHNIAECPDSMFYLMLIWEHSKLWQINGIGRCVGRVVFFTLPECIFYKLMYYSDNCISKLKLKWLSVCQVLGLAHIFCKFGHIYWDLLESLFQRVSTTFKWKVVCPLHSSLSEQFIHDMSALSMPGW